MLAENTLLKTACHFLQLLVGFDTLTYRKDYDRSPILVGHQANRDIADVVLYAQNDRAIAPIPGGAAKVSELGHLGGGHLLATELEHLLRNGVQVHLLAHLA